MLQYRNVPFDFNIFVELRRLILPGHERVRLRLEAPVSCAEYPYKDS